MLVGLLLRRRTLRDTKEILPMDEMLDPEMARLRAMRVADLIDGLVGLDRERCCERRWRLRVPLSFPI